MLVEWIGREQLDLHIILINHRLQVPITFGYEKCASCTANGEGTEGKRVSGRYERTIDTAGTESGPYPNSGLVGLFRVASITVPDRRVSAVVTTVRFPLSPTNLARHASWVIVPTAQSLVYQIWRRGLGARESDIRIYGIIVNRGRVGSARGPPGDEDRGHAPVARSGFASAIPIDRGNGEKTRSRDSLNQSPCLRARTTPGTRSTGRRTERGRGRTEKTEKDPSYALARVTNGVSGTPTVVSWRTCGAFRSFDYAIAVQLRRVIYSINVRGYCTAPDGRPSGTRRTGADLDRIDGVMMLYFIPPARCIPASRCDRTDNDIIRFCYRRAFTRIDSFLRCPRRKRCPGNCV